MAWAKVDKSILGSVASLPRFMGLSALTLLSLALLSPSALAQNAGGGTCTIIVDNTPGILRQNADTSLISSRVGGGLPGRAQIITTTGRFRASIDAPSGFSVFPNGGNNNTIFGASFSSTGKTNFLSVPAGVEQNLKRGISNIEVHMEARRLTGSFPSGSYRAAVTLRCE